MQRFYYQHIGEALFERDAPRSLGRPGLPRQFSLDEARTFNRFNETGHGVQIWGLPSGAAVAAKHMDADDYLLLLESDRFRYIGKVVFRWPQPQPEISALMWGEAKFGILAALQGTFVDLPWQTFAQRFGFDTKYHMRGNTMSLGVDRVKAAGFVDAVSVFDWVNREFREQRSD